MEREEKLCVELPTTSPHRF